MSEKQKQDIERAIYCLRNTLEVYHRTGEEADYRAVMKAQNGLYDAIGGMTDYKFIVED